MEGQLFSLRLTGRNSILPFMTEFKSEVAVIGLSAKGGGPFWMIGHLLVMSPG